MPSGGFIEDNCFFLTLLEFKEVTRFSDNFVSLPLREDNCDDVFTILEVGFDEVLTLEVDFEGFSILSEADFNVVSILLGVDFDGASTFLEVGFDGASTLLEVGFDGVPTFLGVNFDGDRTSLIDEISCLVDGDALDFRSDGLTLANDDLFLFTTTSFSISFCLSNDFVGTSLSADSLMSKVSEIQVLESADSLSLTIDVFVGLESTDALR